MLFHNLWYFSHTSWNNWNNNLVRKHVRFPNVQFVKIHTFTYLQIQNYRLIQFPLDKWENDLEIYTRPCHVLFQFVSPKICFILDKIVEISNIYSHFLFMLHVGFCWQTHKFSRKVFGTLLFKYYSCNNIILQNVSALF